MGDGAGTPPTTLAAGSCGEALAPIGCAARETLRRGGRLDTPDADDDDDETDDDIDTVLSSLILFISLTTRQFSETV